MLAALEELDAPADGADPELITDVDYDGETGLATHRGMVIPMGTKDVEGEGEG